MHCNMLVQEIYRNHLMRKIFLAVVYFLLLFLGGHCLAEEQTAEELCRTRNLASCEISGLKFFIDDDCPKGAKILRPHGKERCAGLDEKTNMVEKDQAVAVARQVVTLPEKVEVAAQEETWGIFDNPFLVVAILGVLQGLISRAGLGAFLLVAVVLPMLVTWGMVSGVNIQAEGAEYFLYIGMEYFKMLVYSLLGWGAGLAIHAVALRLLSR